MTDDRRTLAPAKDCRVRKPDGALLDASGEDVAMTPFWQRRIDQGDVVEKTAKPGSGKADA